MAALNSDEIDMPVMDLPDGSDSEQDGDESDGEDMTETDLVVSGLENEDLIGMSVNASIIDSPDGEHLVLTMNDGTSVSSRIEHRIASDSVDRIIDEVVAQVGERAESEDVEPGNVQRTTALAQTTRIHQIGQMKMIQSGGKVLHDTLIQFQILITARKCTLSIHSFPETRQTLTFVGSLAKVL